METWGITTILIVCVIFLYLLFCMLVLVAVNKKTFWVRGEDPHNPCYLQVEDYPFLKREPYVCGYYGKAIRGYIYSSNENDCNKGFIILSHGFFGTHIQYLLDISTLVKNGYKVLAFDQYGCGESDGKNQDNLSVGVFVLENVIRDVIKNNLNENLPIFLYGHSWGGYSVSAALKKYPSIKKAVVRSGFISPVKVGLELLKMKLPKFAIFITPGVYFAYFIFFGFKGFTKGTRGLKKNKRTQVLYVYAKNDKMISNDNSLACYYQKHKHANATVFITERGLHNSLLTEEGQNRYHELVKQYKEIEHISDSEERKKKEASFLLSLDRVKEYPYDEEVKKRILDFLAD